MMKNNKAYKYCNLMEKTYADVCWWKKGSDDYICPECKQSLLPEWEKEMSYTIKQAWKGPLQVDGCQVSNIDWVFRSNGRNNKNNIMFLEQKNHMKQLKQSQINFYGEIDEIYSNQTLKNYIGIYLIKFIQDYWHQGAVIERLYFKKEYYNYRLDVERTTKSRKPITQIEFQKFLKEKF